MPQTITSRDPKKRRRRPSRPAGFKVKPQLKMTPKEFAAALDELDISARELAERLDINRVTVHAYLNGKFPVPTPIALSMRQLKLELEKERDASRQRLRDAGYSAEDVSKILAAVPSSVAMALSGPPRAARRSEPEDAEADPFGS